LTGEGLGENQIKKFCVKNQGALINVKKLNPRKKFMKRGDLKNLRLNSEPPLKK
jgi:hypothetical protein